MSCGGLTEPSSATGDAGPTVDTGVAPQKIAVGDAGLICSVPVVSQGDSAMDECTFVMNCTNGTATLTVDGRCFGQGQGAVVSCSVNGKQTNSFTALGASSSKPFDCTNPAGLASVAIPCGQ